MVDGPAQTNLQLYNQLIALSWPDAELGRVRAAYEMAEQVFSDSRRCSGKPFLAHLCGTASVVADVDGRPDPVVAALLHSVYTFGRRAISPTAHRRSTVRSVVGDDAEALVFAYTTMPWGPHSLAEASEHLAELDAMRRDVLLLRLANEADEHAYLGCRYCDKGGLFRGDDPTVLSSMAELADRLERPRLAAALRRYADEERDAAIPPVLRSSARAATGSSTPLLPVSARAMRKRGRALLASVPGARTMAHMVRGFRPGSPSSGPT
jgi:hypothetical protein